MGGKSWGRGVSKIICVLGVKERPKVIASRRISSLLRLCPREVMLLFFSSKRGMKSVHPQAVNTYKMGTAHFSLDQQFMQLSSSLKGSLRYAIL